MTALLLHKLLQVIEQSDPPDAKTLRECTAVLKELSALDKSFAPIVEDEEETGVIVLPEVQEEQEA